MGVVWVGSVFVVPLICVLTNSEIIKGNVELCVFSPTGWIDKLCKAEKRV